MIRDEGNSIVQRVERSDTMTSLETGASGRGSVFNTEDGEERKTEEGGEGGKSKADSSRK